MKHVYGLFIFLALFSTVGGIAQTTLKVTLLSGTTPAPGIRVLLNDPTTGSVVGDLLTDANGEADFGNIGVTRTTVSIVTSRTETFGTFTETSKNILTFVNIPVGNFTFQAEDVDEPTLATFDVQLTDLPANTSSTVLFVAGGGGYGSGLDGLIRDVKVTPRNLQPVDAMFSLTAEAMDAQGSVLGWGSLVDADPAAVEGTTQFIAVNIPPISVDFTASEPVAFEGGRLLRKGVLFDIEFGEPHEQTFVTSDTLRLCSIVGVEKIHLEAHTEETTTSSAKGFGTVFTVPPNPTSWQITLPDLSIDSLLRSADEQTISWTRSGANLGEVDAAFTEFSWGSTSPSGSIRYGWLFVGDPATSSLTLPALPGDLADRVPPTSDVEISLELAGLDNVTGFEDLLQKLSVANGNFDVGVLFNATEIVSAAKTISLVTSVEQTSDELPTEYTLSQNFPNPFNPVTNIEFSLPKSGYVTLTVFNTLGQQIEKLVSQNLTPGTYRAQWNATGFASGVYFYRLQAPTSSGQIGGIVETRKLLLLK